MICTLRICNAATRIRWLMSARRESQKHLASEEARLDQVVGLLNFNRKG